jgi:hypothetical protein
MAIPSPSQAVLNARQRRGGLGAASEVRWQWFLREVSDKIKFTLLDRTKIITSHVMSKVVKNLSTPVVKGTGPMGGRVVVNRSKPGEFPRAETTQLMKTIFSDVVEFVDGSCEGYIGTPLDYGVILELKMNRSFLVRTLDESRPDIVKVLTGPIK